MGTSLEQFKASLNNTAARRYLGLSLTDEEAAGILEDDAATAVLYGDWLRRQAFVERDAWTAGTRSDTAPTWRGAAVQDARASTRRTLSDDSDAPVPGWYPDGSGAVRWWDGTGWTLTALPFAPTRMTNALAGWGLGLGITAILLNFLLMPGVLAIIFGAVGLRRSAAIGVGRRSALWAIWLGSIGTFVTVLGLVNLAQAIY